MTTREKDRLLHRTIPSKHSNPTSISYTSFDDDEFVLITPYSSTIGLAMGLNYVIGTGCFGLPFAFMKAGIFLTSILLIVSLMGALITMNYTLEALARAEGISSSIRAIESGPKHQLTFRKFDFSAIGDLFSGSRGKAIVQSVMVMYCLGSLWSYASVFASSVASLYYTLVLQTNGECDVYSINATSGCLNTYFVSMMLFAGIVISMALYDISEQASIQQFLSLYRIIAISLMLITMIIKMMYDGYDVIIERYQLIGAVNWQNFGSGFGPTLLALTCHYNMPDVLQPLQPKSAARQVAFGTLIISGIFYLLIGVLGALAFDEINPLASLMWTTYTGCGSGWDECSSNHKRSFLGMVIHVMVVMFPVLNVVSSYPMVGVTVGDNIFTSLSTYWKERLGIRAAKRACRLVAVIPPILLATAFKKLDLIFSISGLLGFALGYTLPCWFQVTGNKKCKLMWGDDESGKTPYTMEYISTTRFAMYFMFVTIFVTIVATATLNV